jgi:hypothetical protein
MREAIDTLSNEAALQKTGLLIDVAGDINREEGTAHALQWCEALAGRKPRPSQQALLE